ncbi:VLRF1 family aeRF1-type release factor [Halobacillus sp. MO56]
MDMNKEIKKLESVYLEKPQRVFSMYLNTDPSDPDQQGGEWKIHLKNGLNNFESYLKEDGDSDEKRNFWAVKEKVENYVHENEQNFAKSLVIFATADDTVWFAERFQMPVETEFHWEETAKLDQLKKMYDQFPKTGIILTQKEAIKILDTELGTLKETQLFELDLDTEDWKQHTGPHRAQPSMGSGGKSTKQEQFQERFEANRYRWYKSLAPKLDKLAKDNQWERIYVVGDKEEAADLTENMNKEINDVVNKNMLDHEEMKVINEVVSQ